MCTGEDKLTPICCSDCPSDEIVDDEFFADEELELVVAVEFLVRQRFDTNGMAGILKLTCRFPITF